ncbi:MAG: SEC-C metal-binding domain-containing protein [Alphaproteobacteria bacterium]|nr:SEC-C metal-binding domain-containing protein [Alphaproteobacteria bacterium]
MSEKLGRNDLCPCGSGRRFQSLLHEVRAHHDGTNRNHYFQGIDGAVISSRLAVLFLKKDTMGKQSPD